MKHKVSELTGAELDAAVARAEGLQNLYRGTDGALWDADQVPRPYRPSTDWALAGPIIERERIAAIPPNEDDRTWWCAGFDPTVDHGSQCDSGWLDLPAIELRHEHLGPTLLIAAMRAYAASKFGDTVELPA